MSDWTHKISRKLALSQKAVCQYDIGCPFYIDLIFRQKSAILFYVQIDSICVSRRRDADVFDRDPPDCVVWQIVAGRCGDGLGILAKAQSGRERLGRRGRGTALFARNGCDGVTAWPFRDAFGHERSVFGQSGGFYCPCRAAWKCRESVDFSVSAALEQLALSSA